MADATGFTGSSIEQFRARVGDALRGAGSLEEAAQRFISAIYDEWSTEIVLARLFVTQPHAKLPADVRAFVASLAASKGISHRLEDDLPVLALLSTRGARASWNDRSESQGHLGIPLAGAQFVRSIPMLARLFQELGMDLMWFDDAQPGLARRLVGGGFNGVFYVEDAASTLDQYGRHVITDKDFVAANGIKTVFGMGGVYAGGATIAVIVFSREMVERAAAKRFAVLISHFKSATSDLMFSERVFAASSAPR
jgi:hypothetical protein